jgi:hypothetical protein
MKPCLKTAAAREQKNAGRGEKPRGEGGFNNKIGDRRPLFDGRDEGVYLK